MKKLAFILFLITASAGAQLLDRDYTKFSIWVDPVVTVKEGTPQVGLELTKVMHWGWVSASVSYIELTPSYMDAVGSGGLNLNLFNYDAIRYYAGIRLGALWREGKYPFPLVGGVIGFDWQISRGFSLGLRGWIDYRDDQEEQWYGDYDAYEPGLITNNALLQENGAIVMSFNW